MNRITTLIIRDYEIKKMLISIEIPQGLLLSLILYLFYTAELLEACNNTSERLNINKFINDINLLVYKSSMKCNCSMLIKTHDKCLN